MLERADQRSDELLKKYVASPEKMSPEEFRTLTGYLQIYLSEQVRVYGEAQAQVALMQLLYSTQPLSYDYEYAGSSQARNAYGADWFREPSQNEQLYREALRVARIGSAQEAMAKPGNEAIYLLGGGLGNTIRVLAAANGTAQASKGVEQGLEGDYWNAAGNILFGVLGIATIAVPGAKVPVLRAPDGTTAKVAAEGAKGVGQAGTSVSAGGSVVKESIDPASAKFVFDFNTGRYRDVSTGQFVSERNLPWPSGGGFVSSTQQAVPPGTIIDRFGKPSGRYAGTPGATGSQRGMVPGADQGQYTQYRVIKLIDDVKVGPAAPVADFGATGGATQYKFRQSLQRLLDNKYLEVVR
ncbi:TNT domain-containing protein [Pseudomonas sp. TMP9]|uniref:TNT domain-containing protein n=1 Tax=Pseudomonas sp. TMP9 TaxID=3133144 RepID=UPI0030CFD66A